MIEQPMMFGIEPPAALRARSPVPTPGPWPAASPALAAVLGQITSLSRYDQGQLARAFRAAEVAARPARPRLLGGRSYKGWDDFAPAFTAARQAAADAFGPRWYLNPDLSMHARLPAGWTSCRTFGRTSVSPRDVNFPRAQFWPGGILPTGPEYAEIGPLDPEGDIRTAAERQAKHRAEILAECPELAGLSGDALTEAARERKVKQAAATARKAAANQPAPDFTLEYTPAGEITVPEPEYA